MGCMNTPTWSTQPQEHPQIFRKNFHRRTRRPSAGTCLARWRHQLTPLGIFRRLLRQGSAAVAGSGKSGKFQIVISSSFFNQISQNWYKNEAYNKRNKSLPLSSTKTNRISSGKHHQLRPNLQLTIPTSKTFKWTTPSFLRTSPNFLQP